MNASIHPFFHHLKYSTIAVIFTAFSACGGGGNGGGGLVPPAPAAPTYSYYTGAPTATSAVGGLFSVSSASPGAPATVDASALATTFQSPTSISRNETLYTGNTDAASGTISNYRPYAVVFAANGRLYKQYVDQAPAPVQVSNVTNIGTGPGDGTASATTNDLCDVTTVPDFANPENSIVIYAQAGANRICGNTDDVYSWLRLNTNASTAPALLTVLPVAPVYSDTGAITNTVAINALGRLVKLDANFGGTATTISFGPFIDGEWLGHLSLTRTLLFLRGFGATTGELRIVDTGANSLTGVLGTITNGALWSKVHAYDSSYVYFVGNDAVGTAAGVIQRFPVSGTAAATTFLDASTVLGFTAQITDLDHTSNAVVVEGNNGAGSYGIVSAPKNGAAAVIIASSTTEGIFLYGVSNTGYVYYDRWPATFSGHRAEAKRDDGTGLVTYGDANGAEWVGFHYATAFSAFDSESYYQHLVVAEYAAAATDMAGATLSVVNPGTAAKNGTVVGTVPAGIQYLYGAGEGTRALWRGFDGDNEIFYADTAVAGSLTRVTTDAVNQQLIY